MNKYWNKIHPMIKGSLVGIIGIGLLGMADYNDWIPIHDIVLRPLFVVFMVVIIGAIMMIVVSLSADKWGK